MDGLLQDVRYGLRVLWKSRIYTFVAVLTLLLGIGASTAIFSVVYGVLLRPLPYQNPERIVRVWEANPSGRKMHFADPNFEDMRAQVHSLQGMAQMRAAETTVVLGNAPDRVRVAQVSADFFSVMAVHTILGRLFGPEEQRAGTTRTVIVSHSFWQRRLHETQDLASVKFTVFDSPAVIIGVLPAGFRYPDDSDVWTPRELAVRLPSRTAHNWPVIARIRDGASLDQARADLSTVARRISQENGLDEKGMADAIVQPLKDALTSDVKPALLVLLGVAGLLLLVACANVMNLSLAQASARADELAVRVALGASRWRLLRQFLAEALLLCLMGGALGVIAAYFGVRALLALAPPNISRLNEVAVNLPVLAFGLGLSFLVAASLRRAGLFGRAANTRNRSAHCIRRNARQDPRDGFRTRIVNGREWGSNRSCGITLAHPNDAIDALRNKPQRSSDNSRDNFAGHAHSNAGIVHSRASRDTRGPNDCVTL